MSTNSEQNGRQTTPHQQSSAPKDPRTRKGREPSSNTATASVNPKICRDYIWGICIKGAGCRYKHELEYNSMRATLKFCHNFQNRGACDWPDCTYLHISRDEENLFVSTGQIPRLLAERYAAMSIYEYMAAPPPPPPPQPSPPEIVPASDLRFDPSRPPPSLPSKRHAPDSVEAGTSVKLRKVDSSDILCDNCIQQDLRIKIYEQEMERVQQEEDKQRLIFKKKVDDFQNGKLLLRSMLTPKWYCIMENYIEGTNQGNNLFSQSTLVSTSTVPRQFLLQLVEHVFNNANSGNILESTQSTSRESSVLESLSSLSRLNSGTTSSSPDTLQTLLEALRPSLSRTDQQMQGGQQNASEHAGATGNGLTRISNSSVPPGPGPMPAPAPFVTSSVSTGPVPPPARPYYAQPYLPPVQPQASAPQCASQPQPQPYYGQQYVGVSGPAAQYAAAAPPYPSGSSVGVAPQYPPTGADYSFYYPSTPSYQ